MLSYHKIGRASTLPNPAGDGQKDGQTALPGCIFAGPAIKYRKQIQKKEPVKRQAGMEFRPGGAGEEVKHHHEISTRPETITGIH